MVLSITKLTGILMANGLVPQRYFVQHGTYVYVEVMCSTTADLFLLYVPSRYEIAADDRSDTYKLESLDVPEDREGHLAENYAGEPDDFALEQMYQDIDVDLKTDDQKRDDIVEHLEEGYRVSVSLQDLTKDEMMELRDTFRQLRRLRFCVQGIKYKLAIIYQNQLCCIHRDDELIGYRLRNFPRADIRSLLITIDLETLIGKPFAVPTDISTVRQAVYGILDRNQVRNARHLTRLVQQRDFTVPSQLALQKKERYGALIIKLEKQLKSLHGPERAAIGRIAELQRARNTVSMNVDVDHSQRLAVAEKRLREIQNTKQEIVLHVVTLRRKQEELALKIDRILFNLFVMVDGVSKLVEKLRTL
jgi:hypothetical protein